MRVRYLRLGCTLRSTFRQSALAYEKRALPSALRDRHQLIARQPAPRRQIFLDRDLGRQYFQQTSARQRIDVAPNHEQQAAAAILVATVETYIGCVWMM